MGDDFRLSMLEAQVRQLRAMVVAMRTSSGAAPVDFAVDMFDRKNSDDLGSYWAQGADLAKFSIRGNRAVCSNTTGGIHRPRMYEARDTNEGPKNSFALRADASAHDATPRALFYLHPPTVSDLTVKITFDAPPQAQVTASPITGDKTAYEVVAYLLSGGAALGSKNGLILAALMRTIDSPGSFGVGGSVAAMRAADVFLTDFTSVGGLFQHLQSMTASTLENLATAAHATIQSQMAEMVASALTAGSNTLTLSAKKDVFAVTLNGVPLFSGSPGALVERQKVGICAFGYNSISDAIGNNLPFWGISSFKAWRADMPEPPNQSGHGVYRAGESVAYVYADRYHKPTQDQLGNLTGYTYTPDQAG